jgi:hypothetical protein
MKISKQAEKTAANLFRRLLDSGWVKVPPGFKLVPIEPTLEQQFAGNHQRAAEIYRAMVAAAPSATSVLNGEG